MRESIFAATRDAMYGWTAERLVRSQAALGQPSFLYMFDHGYPAADERGLHGFHASELPYLFGTRDRTPPLWPKPPATPAEAAMSEAIADYWASFASSGTPRADNAPPWPAYDAEGRAWMHFADRPKAERELSPGMFELHEEVVRKRRAAGNVPWNWNVGLAAPSASAGGAGMR